MVDFLSKTILSLFIIIVMFMDLAVVWISALSLARELNVLACFCFSANIMKCFAFSVSSHKTFCSFYLSAHAFFITPDCELMLAEKLYMLLIFY